jgi:hypothetical protein
MAAGGNGVDKAKTVMRGAIIGLLVATAAFALVNTFVKIEPPSTVVTPSQEVTIPNT